ncbi:winged helix-turn-helix transcriptional regulator [Nocardia miyunensis]|uniref:winged helix-turn-helix transcriptional regulator n=1 Tax=Nocardia miyunensis TaxID=282684 RepID=UPI00083107F5|nr:winged helix-turn-helix transcriptional regulator [Nocardia miyunensis]
MALHRLLGHGLIERRGYAQAPPRVEYGLTDLGASLVAGPMTALGAWIDDPGDELLAAQNDVAEELSRKNYCTKNDRDDGRSNWRWSSGSFESGTSRAAGFSLGARRAGEATSRSRRDMAERKFTGSVPLALPGSVESRLAVVPRVACGWRSGLCSVSARLPENLLKAQVGLI